MDGVPGATCLIWEHVIESNGKPCSNPRVIIPRGMIENIVPGNEPQEVNVRSFGVRMPPSTACEPELRRHGSWCSSCPTSIAWLWRLIAPRGFKNPSIADSNAGSGLKAEGVGSYWPFATGMKVTQANMLLHQLMDTPETLNILIPNQHIGAYNVGFMGEWLIREYLARRSGTVRMKHLAKSRCPLFGYSLDEMKIDGQYVRQTFLRPELQSKLGFEGFDAGTKILTDFFKEQLPQFLTDDLDPARPTDYRAVPERCAAGGLSCDNSDAQYKVSIAAYIRKNSRSGREFFLVFYMPKCYCISHVLLFLRRSDGYEDSGSWRRHKHGAACLAGIGHERLQGFERARA